MFSILFVPQREWTSLSTYTLNFDSNQPAYQRRLFRIRYPGEETWHPWLSKMCPVKILIRLCECTVWSESSLGAHVWRYVFWRCSFYYLSQRTTNPIIRLARPAKTQISLQAIKRRINENHCYTEWMYRLVLVFACHTDLIVGFPARWLSYVL